MKMCVFGAGAIGGHLAARLSKAGADVSVVARGANLEAMQARGLLVRTPDGDIHAPVRASADARELGPQDAVIVTVKAPALPAIATALQPLLGPDTPVVFVMNGIPWWYFHQHGGDLAGRRLEKIDPGNAVWDAIGPRRAIGGVIYSSCTVVEPGVISATNKVNRLILGEPDDSESGRVRQIADVFAAGGMTMETTQSIREAVWAKLLLNISSGALGILGLASTKALYAEQGCVDASHALIHESLAIAKAMGFPLPLPQQLAKPGGGTDHVPSITQDLQLGRPMEVEAMFGAPLDLARMKGVATPLLEMMVALVKVRARGAGLYAG